MHDDRLKKHLVLVGVWYVPGPVAVLGSGAEGKADSPHAFGSYAGTAAHQLVQKYSYLPVVRALLVRSEA